MCVCVCVCVCMCGERGEGRGAPSPFMLQIFRDDGVYLRQFSPPGANIVMGSPHSSGSCSSAHPSGVGSMTSSLSPSVVNAAFTNGLVMSRAGHVCVADQSHGCVHVFD